MSFAHFRATSREVAVDNRVVHFGGYSNTAHGEIDLMAGS